MNITILTPVFHPSVGGVQAVAAAYARGLKKRGCRVTVITSAVRTQFQWFLHKETLLPRREELNGVHIIRIRPRWGAVWRALFRLARCRVRGVHRLLSALMGDTLDVFQGPWIHAGKPLGASEPDVQIVLWPYFRAVNDAVALKNGRGTPLIVVPVFHMGHERVEDSFLRNLLAADWIVCLTSVERDAFAAAGVPSERIGILGCGVDSFGGVDAVAGPAVRARNLPAGFKVCYLGRLDPAKGLSDLVEAGRRFLGRQADTCLVLMGASCPETPIVMKAVDGLPVELRRRVVVISDFPDAERGALLSAMDLVVLPSTAESFGIAVIEAWAVGKPVVVCSGTAPARLVEECLGGLTYRSGDSSALADAVLRLKSEPKLARSMGEAGRRLVEEKHTWDSIVDRLYEKCRELKSSESGRGRVSTNEH